MRKKSQWAMRVGFIVFTVGASIGLIASPTPESVLTAESIGATQGSFTDTLQSPELMAFNTAPEEVFEVNGELWESENVGPEASSYQAFEMDHPGDYIPVSWSGVIDPEREIALLAWNHQEDRWDQLSSESGSAPDNTVLEAYVSEDHSDAQDNLHIAVVGEDPFMSGSEDWEPVPDDVNDNFRDPETYDFSVAHVTDTQFLSEGAVDPELDEETQERFASAYRDQMNWIVDNADLRDIAYVAHTGDIIENWMIPEHTEEQARAEFEFASEMQAIIDEGGIPNGILPGNHDNGWGDFGNEMFNDYFPQERYEQASTSWENGTYGGPWEEGDNSAHYDLFEVDDHEFIAVHLPYGHNTAQRSWANDVLEAFPDRDAFLFTHTYLRDSNNDDASKTPGNTGYGGNGHLLRTQVVEENENVVMVASGHYHGTTWNHNFNGDGGPVFEMLGDYQNYEIDGERNTGFMRLLQFNIDAGEVTVNTYSPKLDEFTATGYDVSSQRTYNSESDEYTAPLSLSTRGTTLMTDQIRVGDVNESVTELPDGESEPPPAEMATDEHPSADEPQNEERAKNEDGEDQKSGDLSIRKHEDLTVTAGEEIFPITIDVNDEDANVEIEGLPEGLIGVEDSREISGIPTTPGEYDVTVTGFNQFESTETMSFTITVEETQ